MVRLKTTKIVHEEQEDKEITKVIFGGKINEVKFSLSISGEKEDVNVLRRGLGIEGYGHMVNMELKPIQTALKDFENKPAEEVIENENSSIKNQ